MKGAVPSEARKLIEGIKEIVKGYNDDDIYSMLQECNMDPDETAQRLMSQDPFHEVKRKRDKKKENAGNQIPADGKPRPGNSIRGGRGGMVMGRGGVRASYRPVSHDTGSSKGSNIKENGTYKPANKPLSSTVASATSENVPPKPFSSATSTLVASANGIATATDGIISNTRSTSTAKEEHNISAGFATAGDSVKQSSLQQAVQQEPLSVLPASSAVAASSTSKFQQTIALTPISTSGVVSSTPDPVYVPSADVRVSGVVGAIKRVVGTVGASRGSDMQSSIPGGEAMHTPKANSHAPANAEVKSSGADTAANPIMNEHQFSRSLTPDGENAFGSKVQVNIAVTPGAAASNPSAVPKQYVNRHQQQLVGSQKAIGPNMEWKRKSVNQNVSFSSSGVPETNAGNTSVPENCSPATLSNSENADEATRTQEKLESLNIHNEEDLIMPNHLKVPEAACLGLSFGSFGEYYGIQLNHLNKDLNKGSPEKSSPPSEESQRTEDSNEEPSSRISEPGLESPGEHQEDVSSSEIQILPSDVDVVKDNSASASASQSDPSKQDPIVQMHPQYRPIENTANYVSVGLMPQIIGNQYPAYEAALSAPLDASRQPSIVMHQPYDPSTSYGTIFRPGDSDGRFSPAFGPSAASKFTQNTGFLSGQSMTTSQEAVNTISVSSAASAAPGTQMAGIAPTTVPFPQQQMPLFHQPSGVHLTPLHPYFHYGGQYLSPLYISPFNNFPGNYGYGQPSTGSNFALPSVAPSFPSAATAAPKFSFSQLKPMAGGGNTSQAGFPVGYPNYTAAPSGFSSSSAAASGGNRSGFEENKEANMYIPNQQVEAPFWYRTPQNISSLQSSSYYSLSAQGQNMAFTPPQSGHAAYAGVYHAAAQSGVPQNSQQMLQQSEQLAAAAAAAAAVGNGNTQTGGGYPHSQPGQLNWNNNY